MTALAHPTRIRWKRPPTAAIKLSALIVNYDSGAFALACVESLQAEWSREGRHRADLEIVVVDNASPTDQERWLAEIAARGAKVVHSAVNGGYAAGMELALAHTSGSARDLVAVLNPDIVFLEGSLRPLIERLQMDPDCGAIAPRAFVDEACTLQLPRIPSPTPFEHLFACAADLSPIAGRWYARRRFARALEWWTSEAPLDADMLSGACVFLRRKAIERAGALFDACFPLYFEDADLCRRLSAAGYRLAYEPRARIVHHWSRSAGSGERFAAEPMSRYWTSRARFVEKHAGTFGRWIERQSARIAAAWPVEKRMRPIHAITELGAVEAPPVIALGCDSRFVIEIGLSPTWILAAGVLGEGRTFELDPRAWAWLFPGRYFARAIDRDSKRVLGAWSFTKTTAARVESLRALENTRAEAA